jgi:predicted DNA binding protein
MRNNYSLSPVLVDFTYVHESDWTAKIKDFDWYYRVTQASINDSRGKVIEVATLRINHKHELRMMINTLYRSGIGVIYIKEINPGYPKYVKIALEGDVSNSTRYIAQQYDLIEAYAYYENGIEHWGFIGFNNNNTRSFISRIGDHGKVVSVKFRRLNIEDLLNINALRLDVLLNPGEYRILKYAFERGFFSIPKELSMDELAKELNLSKSTVDRSLRSSIYKILRVIMRSE